jgi:hypothetical protein
MLDRARADWSFRVLVINSVTSVEITCADGLEVQASATKLNGSGRDLLQTVRIQIADALAIVLEYQCRVRLGIDRNTYEWYLWFVEFRGDSNGTSPLCFDGVINVTSPPMFSPSSTPTSFSHAPSSASRSVPTDVPSPVSPNLPPTASYR